MPSFRTWRKKATPHLLTTIIAGSLLATPMLAKPPKADRVIGQATFLSKGPPDAPATGLPFTSSSLNGPGGVAVSPVSGKLFVADYFNNRVTRYTNFFALANGAAAEDSVATSVSNGAWSIFVDSRDALWIADTAGYVSRYNNASSVVLATATPSATLNAPGCEYLFVDARDTLWVTYGANSPTATWLALASTFTNSSSITPAWTGTLKFTNKPQLEGIAVAAKGATNTTLWIADAKNNKVYRFDNPKNNQNEKNAAAVLGQPQLSSTGPKSGAAGLSYPRSLFIDKKGSLWVADTANNQGAGSANRVLRWDKAAKLKTGAKASAVVGQTSYTTKLTGTSANLIAPFRGGIWVDLTGKLWLADDLNNRVLRFKRITKLKAPGTSAN
jgi:DNA-binding beta-propeller fold protein YncE